MIPLEGIETNHLDCLYTIEFYTLGTAGLIRKEEAEREWRESEGLEPGPLDWATLQVGLRRLLATFTAEGRLPRWVQFHPEVPPALVANIPRGKQVVIQVREYIEARPGRGAQKGAFTHRACTPPPVFK